MRTVAKGLTFMSSESRRTGEERKGERVGVKCLKKIKVENCLNLAKGIQPVL